MEKHSFLPRKPSHVTTQNDHLRKTSSVLTVLTHISGISKEIDGKMFIFQVNLGMWPLQINHLAKTSPVLRVSTHIYGVSKEIDGKTFIFSVNLDMWPLKSIISQKQALFWEFQHPFMQLPSRLMEKCSFSSKPRHVTPQINHLGETSPVLVVTTHVSGLSKEIDGEMFIFQVNPDMWPLKSIDSEKWALCWGFQHTFMAFWRR